MIKHGQGYFLRNQRVSFQSLLIATTVRDYPQNLPAILRVCRQMDPTIVLINELVKIFQRKGQLASNDYWWAEVWTDEICRIALQMGGVWNSTDKLVYFHRTKTRMHQQGLPKNLSNYLKKTAKSLQVKNLKLRRSVD